MPSRASSNRLSHSSFKSRIGGLMLAMFASMATIYVAGRLWQDAASRVYFIQEIKKKTDQSQSVVSVEDTLKIINCREQKKKMARLEMELAAARHEGFVSQHSSKNDAAHSEKKLLAVVGIITTFGHNNNRDAIRKAWMPTGTALKKLEDEKGILVRFVIGRSANRGDGFDKEIDDENSQTNDIIVLDDQVEGPEELPEKVKSFFVHAVENWDAEFYAKVNDDVYVSIDALGALLSRHLGNLRAYVGCMKSGTVISEPTQKWYEPDWWKFGDAKTYLRHASGEIFAISQALAQFLSINRSILRTYSNDDITAGSWFIGLDVKHVHEPTLCCSSWSAGAICAVA